jgi:hypothetical protein
VASFAHGSPRVQWAASPYARRDARLLAIITRSLIRLPPTRAGEPNGPDTSNIFDVPSPAGVKLPTPGGGPSPPPGGTIATTADPKGQAPPRSWRLSPAYQSLTGPRSPSTLMPTIALDGGQGMEASETKPTSRRARFWARLSDPDKRPRCWWFPPSSRRGAVLHMSEAAQQGYQTIVQQAHEKFSETVRLTMFSLLGFALFCLLITFSVPDGSLLVADPTVKMPFADVQVSFQNFVFLAPVLLSAVAVYLHIFYGSWLDLDMHHRHLTLSRESGGPPIDRLPTLFSLDRPVPRLLTAFIFYWLVPLVLVAMTWKAAARVEWGVPLIIITGVVTAMLVFLRIRRRPASQRQWIRHRLH